MLVIQTKLFMSVSIHIFLLNKFTISKNTIFAHGKEINHKSFSGISAVWQNLQFWHKDDFYIKNMYLSSQ